MNYKTLASAILKRVGGRANITQAWHCFTRLRFNLADASKADLEGLKSLEGVLKAQFQGDQLQVIVGNTAGSVYAELKALIGEVASEAAPKKKEKFNPINTVFDTISGIFSPIIAAITGAGLLKGILSLLVFLNWVNAESSEYFVLNMISDAAFYFLPFLLAFSAARKFKTNEFVAASLAGIIMYPAFSALDAGAKLRFFIFDIPAANYSSSVLPIILGVLLLSIVYRYLDKYMPKMLRMIFTPLLSLLIVGPLTLFLIAPLGNYVGAYVAQFFVWLFNVAGPIAGMLMAGLMPFIVMAGMHYALFPIALDSLGRLGFDIILLPMNLVNNLAQCAATLAVGIKTKNKEMRSLAFSSSLPALFGITEPAMYGVTLKLKKPMYAAMIGSGVGGAIYGFFAVKTFMFSIPGITLLPAFISAENPLNFVFACVGLLASVVFSFVLTLIFPFDTSPVQQQEQATEKPTLSVPSVGVLAPLSGKLIPLDELGDDIFAREVLGKGVGIVPSEGVVRSPFDGVVSMVADTKHAIGLISNDGIELLIHIGMNTVSLDGKGFETLVKNGQSVEKGQELLKFDNSVIVNNGLSPATAIIVTNSDSYSSVLALNSKTAKAGVDEILNITQ